MKKLMFLLAFLSAIPASAGFVVQQQLEVSVTTASTKFLNANTSRSYLLVINNGSNSVVVKFGAVQAGSEGVLIPSGGNYELNNAVPIDSVYMKSASGTQLVTLIEG